MQSGSLSQSWRKASSSSAELPNTPYLQNPYWYKYIQSIYLEKNKQIKILIHWLRKCSSVSQTYTGFYQVSFHFLFAFSACLFVCLYNNTPFLRFQADMILYIIVLTLKIQNFFMNCTKKHGLKMVFAQTEIKFRDQISSLSQYNVAF